MIGYVLLGTNDLEKAKAFYDATLAPIGAGRIMETERICAWAIGHDMTKPSLGVTLPYDGNSATVGNGTMPALVVDDRAIVDTVHATALANGGSDEGAPGVRGDEGEHSFYGAYFRDPDGNKLAVFRIGPP